MRLKKKMVLKTFALLFTVACCAGITGCKLTNGNTSSEDSSSNIESTIVAFEGLTDIKISKQTTEYNFTKNVFCKDASGNVCAFTVDSASVAFGTTGKYVVKYSSNDFTEERTVYIYGQPTISVAEQNIPYQRMYNGDISAFVTAKDSFGESLQVSLKGEANYTENGALATGNQTVTVVATDCVGNVKEQAVTLNVLPSEDSFAISVPTIDYAKAYYKIEVGERKLKSVYYNGTKATQSMYIANGNIVAITPGLIRALGVGDGKEVYFNFDTCSVKVTFSITDNQPTNYLVNGAVEGNDYWFDDKIELPIVTLSTASAQDVEFVSFIEQGGNRFEYGEEIYYPTEAGAIRYVVEVYKNGQLEQSLEESFTVKDQCYFLQNFAATEYLEYWDGYDKENMNLTADSVDMVSCLKYYKPNANGTEAAATKTPLYLKPELIAAAKQAGYTRLSFSYKTVKDPMDVTLSSCFVLYKEEGGKNVGNYLVYRADANNNWLGASVDLSQIAEGQGLKFVNYGTTLYLANLTFKGKDFNITDFEDDFAQEKYLTHIWERNNVPASTISVESVTKNGTTFKAVKLVKDTVASSVTGTYTGSQNNSLYLNEMLIASAVKAGYKKLSFYYATEKYSAGGTTAGAFVCYKYSKGVMGSTYTIYDNGAWQAWKQVTIDISDYKEGDTLKFNCYGATMYIANLTFVNELGQDPFMPDVFED